MKQLLLCFPQASRSRKRRRDSCCHNLNGYRVYGVERVPCDTSMREILDPVVPECLRPLFQQVFRVLQRGKALEGRVFVQEHDLIACDGTGYFSSNQMHGASW